MDMKTYVCQYKTWTLFQHDLVVSNRLQHSLIAIWSAEVAASKASALAARPSIHKVRAFPPAEASQYISSTAIACINTCMPYVSS